MTEVKGVIIQSTPKIILDKFGQYGLKRWLELISPQARRVFSVRHRPGSLVSPEGHADRAHGQHRPALL